MAFSTYDMSNGSLAGLLSHSGISNPTASDIISRSLAKSDDNLVAIETDSASGAVLERTFDEGHGHKDYPQIVVLQSSNNTIDTSDFSKLQFIVKASAGNLEVTGNRSVEIAVGGSNVSINLDDYGKDTVVTGNGSDTVYGGHGADSILTGDGNRDLLVAGSGDHQTLQAGDGNHDTLTGGVGVHDSLSAGDGNFDSLTAGAGDFQTIQAGSGNHDTLHGGSGSHDSVAAGDGVGDRLYAGSGDHQTIQAGDGIGDSLYGGGSHDLVQGGGNSSALYADDGSLVGSHETLLGGKLAGGGGNDLFKVGDVGNDTITGGGGKDTLEFTDHDSAADVQSTHTAGGVTTITFDDGQKVSYSGITTVKFDH
jgi:Ca2+-binding RTX toxin-like protein